MLLRRLITRLLPILLASATVLPVSATPTGPTTTLGPELRVTRLQSDAYVVTHLKPFPANALVVEMGDGSLVVCNTTYTEAAADLLLAWLKGRFGTRRIVAINTHFHVDTLGGNARFQAAGIPVYGADETVALLAERGEAVRQQMLDACKDDPDQQRQMRDLRYAPPNRTFPLRDGLRLRFGSQTAQIHFPGPAHAPDNVVVYFPAQRLLFGGCMVRAMEMAGMGNTVDADRAHWAASATNLLRFPTRWVIPGHGQPGGQELLRHTVELTRPAPVKTLR